MNSTNSSDGRMSLDVSFEVGTDPDMNTVFTQNRVAAATAKLPEEVKRLGVTTEKSLSQLRIVQCTFLTDSDTSFDVNGDFNARSFNLHWVTLKCPDAV